MNLEKALLQKKALLFNEAQEAIERVHLKRVIEEFRELRNTAKVTPDMLKEMSFKMFGTEINQIVFVDLSDDDDSYTNTGLRIWYDCKVMTRDGNTLDQEDYIQICIDESCEGCDIYRALQRQAIEMIDDKEAIDIDEEIERYRSFYYDVITLVEVFDMRPWELHNLIQS